MKRFGMALVMALVLLLAVSVAMAQPTIEVGSLVVVVPSEAGSIEKIDLLQSEGGAAFAAPFVVYPDDTGYVVAVSEGWVKIDPDAVLSDASGWIPVANVRPVVGVEDLVSFGRVVDAIKVQYRIPPSTEQMSYEVFRCPEEPYCVRFDGLLSLVNPFPDQWVDGFMLYPREPGMVRSGLEQDPKSLQISIPPANMLPGRHVVTGATLRPGPSIMLDPELDAYTEVIARAQYGIPDDIPNLRAVWSGTHTWFFYLADTGAQTDASEFTVFNVCDEWVDGIRAVPGETRPDYSDVDDASVISIPPSQQSIPVIALTARPCTNNALNTFGFSWNTPIITGMAG